jgi:hypothetical protein
MSQHKQTPGIKHSRRHLYAYVHSRRCKAVLILQTEFGHARQRWVVEPIILCRKPLIIRHKLMFNAITGRHNSDLEQPVLSSTLHFLRNGAPIGQKWVLHSSVDATSCDLRCAKPRWGSHTRAIAAPLGR